MQAKPGPRKTTKTLTRTFTPAATPTTLTESQKQIWREIADNPYLTDADHSLIAEFITLVTLRDSAFNSLTEQGLLIDDAKGSLKKNPAYQIWRETSAAALHIREHLLMTPKVRMMAALAVNIEDEAADELAALVS